MFVVIYEACQSMLFWPLQPVDHVLCKFLIRQPHTRVCKATSCSPAHEQVGHTYTHRPACDDRARG